MASNNSSQGNPQEDEKWAKKVISFCCTSSIAIALYACQSKSHLPFPFYLISMALLVAFFFSFISILLINSNFTSASKIFDQMGISAAMLAFFMAMAFSIPLSIRFVAWLVCTLSFILMLAYHLYPISRNFNPSRLLLDWFTRYIYTH